MAHLLTGKSGIYALENIKTGDCYVGSARNIHARYTRHKRYLFRGDHQNKYLQRAWNKYGYESFRLCVLEFTTRDEAVLLEREQFYIDRMKPKYNVCRDVRRPPPASDRKIRATQRALSKDYIITKPDGTEVEVTNLSQFCRDNDLDAKQMNAVVRGKQGVCKGWKARLKDDPYPPYRYYKNKRRIVKKDGITYEFDDVPKFCLEHGISTASMQHLLSGIVKTTKGFTLVEVIDEN